MADRDAGKANPPGGKDKPVATSSRFVDESYTPQQIIDKAKESLIILSPDEEEKIRATNDYSVLKDTLESGLMKISGCEELKNFVLKNNLPTPDATHVWNIMHGFLLLTGQKDDVDRWRKVDYAYGKLSEMRYKIDYAKLNKIPAAGGASKIEDATKMFNESIRRGDATAIDRYDLKLRRLNDKVLQQIDYLDELYVAGTTKFSSDFERRIDEEVSKLEREVDTLETEKYNFVKQVEDPNYKFKTLLDKFKTEAEFVSWIEKAKKEHIEAVSEARKTAQTLKSVSTLKKSIDKCVEGMKKSLNGHCEKISKYSSLSDKSKKLESKYRLILSLSAFMVDPGRGISNIREVLEKLGIPSNDLQGYYTKFTDLYSPLKREADTLNQNIRDFILSVRANPATTITMNDLIKKARIKIQEILDLFIKSPFLEKVSLIEPEMTIIRELPDRLKREVFSTLTSQQIFDKLNDDYIGEIDAQAITIGTKILIIASILDTASSAPAMDQIRKLRVQAQSKLTEINDDYAEIKEEDASPIDVGKCLRDYKAGIAAIRTQDEAEFDKIEKEEKTSISQIAQDISKIREATKVNITANIQAQPLPQAPVKPYAQQNLQELLASKQTLENRMNAPDIKENKKNEIKDKISQIDAFIKVKTARGGSRIFGRSTRRKIR